MEKLGGGVGFFRLSLWMSTFSNFSLPFATTLPEKAPSISKMHVNILFSWLLHADLFSKIKNVRSSIQHRIYKQIEKAERRYFSPLMS